MPQNSNNKILRIQRDIHSLMQQGKSSEDIMSTLKIPLRSYRRYCSTIYKQRKEVWYSITSQQLEHELLRLKDSLEHTYRTALAMSEDPEYNDRLQALQAKDDARLSIVQLLEEGPEYSKKVEQAKAHKSQQEIMKQHHP